MFDHVRVVRVSDRVPWHGWTSTKEKLEDYQVLLWLDHPEIGGNISQQFPVTVKDVNKQHFEGSPRESVKHRNIFQLWKLLGKGILVTYI